MDNNDVRKLKKIICIGLFTLSGLTYNANSAEVNSVTTGSNSSGAYEVQIGGSGFHNVKSFSLENPAKIIVDIPYAKSTLTEKITKVTSPIITSVAVIEGDDKVRAVVSLSKNSPHKVIKKADRIVVVVQPFQNRPIAEKQPLDNKVKSAADVNFVRGINGQGKVQIKLANKDAHVNVERKGDKVVARLLGNRFGKSRRLNVINFGTPVKSIDIYKNRLSIATIDDHYDIVSYQSDDLFSIEFNKPAKLENDQDNLPPGDSKKKYTGQPLSLNFQDIGVRAVLQLIGDFTNTNVVVSDKVSGSITLRLNDVPWDQALDIILQTKGLSMQKNGDIIYIGTSNEIAKNKTDAYKVANIDEALAPLQQQIIQVQYARAENLEDIIDDNDSSGDRDSSLLSGRGNISVDPRTNSLIISDVPSSIDKIQRLVAQLDVPVRQVLVDSRIVMAASSFAHSLGIRWGGAFVGSAGSTTIGGAGSLSGASSIVDSAIPNIRKTGQAFPTSAPSLADRLGVKLGSTVSRGSFGISILGTDFLLDLELSAGEDDGRSETISSPRVIAQDGTAAKIASGTKIAVPGSSSTTTTGGGSTTVSDGTNYVDATLSLTVIPKITPNDQVDMVLKITKDAPVGDSSDDISTNSIDTQVLVGNGQTVVLGGVYEQSKVKRVSKIPVLGDLPIVGRAFRRDSNSITKNELLIFVTPKIVKKQFFANDKFSELRD